MPRTRAGLEEPGISHGVPDDTSEANVRVITSRRVPERPPYASAVESEVERPTASPAPPMPRTAAFFDLDKTIIARSSTLAFSRPFYQGGLINRRAVLKSSYAQFVYLVG